MRVLGLTTPQEFYVGSNERKFRINEFLLIEDKTQGNLIGEVVEATTYNPYLQAEPDRTITDDSVFEALKKIGMEISENTKYIAKLRLVNEAMYPVETGSKVRVPVFNELKNFLIKSDIKNSFVLGIIKNTDNLYKDADKEIKDKLYIYEDGEYKKQNDIPFLFDYKKMSEYPHIGIFGGSGSGKSFGLRVLLEEIMQKAIPAIVLDPHYEMDFKHHSDYNLNHIYGSKYKVFNIGRDVGINFGDLNNEEIKNLLDAISPMTEAMRNALDQIKKNKDSFDTFKNRLVSVSNYFNQEFYGEDRQESGQRYNYDEHIENIASTVNQASVKGILWRFNALEREGIFFKNPNEIEAALNEQKLVILQGRDRILKVFASYILSKFYYLRRDYIDSHLQRKDEAEYFPPFVVLTDEAHNFAPKAFDTPSKSIIREIAQEGRKYGVFLVLATQRISLLDETVTAQLNSKLIFRTVRESDIATIKEETDIGSEDAKRLPYLKSGDVFISQSSFGRTVFARIRSAHTESPHRKNPFDELVDERKREDEEFYEKIKDKLPINREQIPQIINYLEDSIGHLSPNQVIAKLDRLCERNMIDRVESVFGCKYISMEKEE